jgi:hypothetical protein
LYLVIVSLKRCKSNIINLSEVMHVGGGVMGRKRGVVRGPLKIFLHLLGGHDEIINESMQNHQPPPLLIKNERSLRGLLQSTQHFYKIC